MQFIYAEGAQILVDVCGAVQPGERAVVITDPQCRYAAEAIMSSLHARNCDAVMLVIATRKQDEEELPEAASAAMISADVAFLPLVKGSAHTEATRKALESGTRIVCLDQFQFPEILTSGGLFADFQAASVPCQHMAKLLGEAAVAVVTSRAGTDIRLNIQGRRGNSHHCIVDSPGSFTAVPNVEANVAPVEGYAEGVIVFDASLPHFGIGKLASPIVLQVAGGRVTSVDGGWEAKRLESVWRDQDDPNVYNIAQLAIGMNPEIREVNGIMLNDHGAYGTVHFGIGTSSNLGGITKATTHFDGIMVGASLILDGTPVLEDGEFTELFWKSLEEDKEVGV